MLKLLTWDVLAQLGKSRAVKSSYLWFLVVPILARWTSLLNEHLTFHLFGAELKFHVGLPFSWYAFYFAALMFAAGTATFQLRCPRIVREHETYAEFLAAGKGGSNLTGYKTNISPVADAVEIATAEHTRDVARANQEAYWTVREHANTVRPRARTLCALFYGVGLLLVLVVAVQSFGYVVRSLLP